MKTEEPKGLTIVKLTSENVKRINAVEITPRGDVVIIGGRNAQGKSSILDGIEMALAGGKSICDTPLRRGSKKGRTVIDLGDLVVTRTYTESGSELKVTGKEGGKLASPQTILDTMAGKLTFDPLGFLRMDGKKQLEQLRQLVGIDFDALDVERERLFGMRTDINRDAKAAETSMNNLRHEPGVPAEEVSAADLTAELTQANAHNKKIDDALAEVERMNKDGIQKKRGVDDQKATVERLEKELAEARKLHAELVDELSDFREKYADKKAESEKAERIDTQPITDRLSTIEETNRKVRNNKSRLTWQLQYNSKVEEAAELTRQIEDIDREKVETLKAIKFPVDGLSLSDTGITFNGLPFEQASGAEKLRVSVAMGMALNPRLKILLCRDGSLLDDESLEMLSQIVRENGYQLWLERVGNADKAAIVIEDGYVKQINPDAE